LVNINIILSAKKKKVFGVTSFGRKEKYISSGVEENLIKSVLQAMPIYAMGIFKILAGLIDDLEQLVPNSWWKRLDQRHTRWFGLSRSEDV
jgi:hypothetical protein